MSKRKSAARMIMLVVSLMSCGRVSGFAPPAAVAESVLAIAPAGVDPKPAFDPSSGSAPHVEAAASVARRSNSCTYPTFRFYPGESVGRLRYGVVEFSFVVCGDDEAREWKGEVLRHTENSTGHNLSFHIDDANIKLINSGSRKDPDPKRGLTRYATWEAQIYWRSCTPKFDWPCLYSGKFTVMFYGTTWSGQGGHEAVDYQVTSIPFGLALFKTP